MTLLAVDPALAGFSGVALFSCKTKALMVATRVRGSDETACETIERALVVAHRIWAWVELRGGAIPTAVIIEWPQIYKASKSEGDPNDLIALAAVGAMIVQRAQEQFRTYVDEDGFVRCKSPTPKQWSGGIPKLNKQGKPYKDAWSSPRGKRIWSVLSEAERALIPNSHDAIDAVGIGLWALGRLAPVRVYPGT